MRYSFVSLLCLIFVIISCGEDDIVEYLTIEEYITTERTAFTETPSGLHYVIREEGQDPKPKLAAEVEVNYEGFFLDGLTSEIFDNGDGIIFPLNEVILGWQEGLQLIGTGGQITLLVPSNLAYGVRGLSPIPGSTDIGFNIDLLGFSYQTIEDFVVENAINDTITSSGLHYMIIDEGEAPSPTSDSDVTISYNKFFLGGDGFQDTTNVQVNVQDLNPGLQEGIQLIGTGGRIRLFVPSELAYGSMGTDIIPPNTDIGIDLSLIEFE